MQQMKSKVSVMRTVIQESFGDPDVLTLGERVIPEPGPGQVLVRVRACGLNRADLLQRRGGYPPPSGETDVLGLEVAGDIEKLGSDVSHWQEGQAVFALVSGGAYAEYCLVDAGMLMPKPEHMSYEQAAAIPEAFLTASEALFNLGQLPGRGSVLIHAGASGVGSAAVQLAKCKSAQVFFTAGRDHKIKLVESLAGGIGINYHKQCFRDVIASQTQGQGVDVIVDFIGASYFNDNINALKTAGRLVHVAFLGGSRCELDLRQFIFRGLQLKGLVMRSRSMEEKRLMTKTFVEDWLPLFERGELKPVIDVTYAIDDVVSAHRYMEANKNAGKIILKLNTP
jgi:putative PIG3 family NAD(P)H quinone oxidoreductase